MSLTCTVSIRHDEQEAFEEISRAFGPSRHRFIKIAIRKFLFPDELFIPSKNDLLTMSDAKKEVFVKAMQSEKTAFLKTVRSEQWRKKNGGKGEK